MALSCVGQDKSVPFVYLMWLLATGHFGLWTENNIAFGDFHSRPNPFPEKHKILVRSWCHLEWQSKLRIGVHFDIPIIHPCFSPMNQPAFWLGGVAPYEEEGLKFPPTGR